MQNVGKSQFSYDVFKAAYDGDPQVKALIKNFDKKKLTFKSDEMDDVDDALDFFLSGSADCERFGGVTYPILD